MKNATLAQGNQIFNLILQKKVTTEKLQKLIESRTLALLLEEEAENFPEIAQEIIDRGISKGKDFKAVVDYDDPMGMVRAGKYETSGFQVLYENLFVPGKGKYEREHALFRSKRDVLADEMIRSMNKRGYEPGEFEDLLAFGATSSGLELQSMVVALGSVMETGGISVVPALQGGDDRLLAAEIQRGFFDVKNLFLARRPFLP